MRGTVEPMRGPVQSRVPPPIEASGSSARTGVLQRRCACGGAAGFGGACEACQKKKVLGKPAQAKLRINEPGDAYEQEADRVAEQVMRMPAGEVRAGGYDKAARPVIQRRAMGGAEGGAEAPLIVHDVLSSSGRPLDAATRAFFEPRFGHDFSKVRVHSGAPAEQSASDVNAHAYTVRHDIVFGAGQFSPGTMEGRRLLAHELAHVVQQTGASGPIAGMGLGIARKQAGATAPAPPAVREMTRDEARAVLASYLAAGGVDETMAAMNAIEATLNMSSTPENWRMRLRVLAAAFSLLDGAGAAIVLKALTAPAGARQKHLRVRFGRLDRDFRAPLLEILRRRAGAKTTSEEQPTPEPAKTLPAKGKGTWVELEEGVFAYQVPAGTTINDVAAYLSRHPDLPIELAKVNNMSRATPLEEGYPVIVSVDLIDQESAIRDMPEPVRRRIASIREARAMQAQYQRFVKVRSGHPLGPGAVGLIPLTTAAITGAIAALKYPAGLIVGLLKGAWKAVTEIFEGAWDLIKTIGKVLYKLITGDIGGIWKMIKGWIKQLKLLWEKRGEIASDFMDKWENKDPWKRGLFQGEVLGWVMMTVLIVILTAGAGAIAQIAGKWKFVIDALKLADRAGDLTTYVRAAGRMPSKATEVVRNKLGLKAGEVAEKTAGKPTKEVLEQGATRRAQELAAEGLAAKLRTADGHDIKITKDGRMWICTDPCDEFRKRYQRVLENSKGLEEELNQIAKIADPNEKAKALAKWKSKADTEAARDVTPTQRTAMFSRKGWGQYVYKGRKLGIVDTIEGPQAWYIRTGKGGPAGLEGPAKGDPSRFHGWAQLEEINPHNKRPIPGKPATEWMIKPEGGRFGQPGTPEAQINKNISDWLKSEPQPAAGRDVGDVAFLNDWLRKNGVEPGGGHKVGDEVTLLSPTKLTELPKTRVMDYVEIDGVIFERKYYKVKAIP